MRPTYLMMSKKKNLLFLWGWEGKAHSLRSLNKSRNAKLWFSWQIFLSHSHTHDIFLYVNNLWTVYHTLLKVCHRLRVIIYRGPYMSTHVLFNLLNELGKRDKMRGLPSILSLFRNEFNKFNNTWVRMLDSIDHMTLRLLWNLISDVRTLQRGYGRHNVSRKSINR